MQKKKVIFVDWYGVLSWANFWHHLPKGSYLRKYITQIEENAILKREVLNSWMRGDLSDREVIEKYTIDCDRKTQEILLEEMKKYVDDINYNQVLCNELKKYSLNNYIVMTTDNMEVFTSIIDRFAEYEIFDKIINSWDVKGIKEESPEIMFGLYLDSIGKTYKDAVLIDDNNRKTDKFKSVGGNAIHYEYKKDSTDELFQKIDRFLDS